MCNLCEEPEDDMSCDESLEQLQQYTAIQIMSLVKEQELLDKKLGVVLH